MKDESYEDQMLQHFPKKVNKSKYIKKKKSAL